jgi:DNA adenine methylase
MMKPPIAYYGGKTYQAPWILDVMKRYDFKAYIEPFGGSGAILFAKEPSPVEVYNDLYSDLVTFYRVLRNPKMYKEFVRFVENSPYSRELFYESKEVLANKKIVPGRTGGTFLHSCPSKFFQFANSLVSSRKSRQNAGKTLSKHDRPFTGNP